jgi:hypothetical protein
MTAVIRGDRSARFPARCTVREPADGAPDSALDAGGPRESTAKVTYNPRANIQFGSRARQETAGVSVASVPSPFSTGLRGAEVYSLATLVAAMVLLVPFGSQAAVLYDSGPINATYSADGISAGFQTADSFELGSRATIRGVSFGLWTEAATRISALGWDLLTGAPFSEPTVLATGTATVFAESELLGGGFGGAYDVRRATFLIGGVTLDAGNYWLRLRDGIVPGGQAYWDVNSGANASQQRHPGGLVRTVDPHAFQLLGDSAVPEPATWALMIIGFGAVGSMIRRSNVVFA